MSWRARGDHPATMDTISTRQDCVSRASQPRTSIESARRKSTTSSTASARQFCHRQCLTIVPQSAFGTRMSKAGHKRAKGHSGGQARSWRDATKEGGRCLVETVNTVLQPKGAAIHVDSKLYILIVVLIYSFKQGAAPRAIAKVHYFSTMKL